MKSLLNRWSARRTIKVIAAIVLHVALHIVSAHLAVAYTVFHIIQHRRAVASIFEKLPLSRTRHNDLLQLTQAAS